ncbi:MAG: TlpA family protein disulfide reductase [Isosphaerales bacterium]
MIGLLPFFFASVVSCTRDESKKAALKDRIIREYPNSPEAVKDRADRLQRGAIGKPFNLSFTDATKGDEVSVMALRGKVVVVDFWATWCGPCVAEMPNMKRLYDEYRDKGVEFIGVSLDTPKEEGGLDKLKERVTKNEIAWPQYYQGKGWESEFSRSWGIHAIPRMFVIDPSGNLYSVEGRGKLDTMIPELLRKKIDATGGM